ncbi:hypothetical protein GCM10010193_26390 [Kitasatospora atroaurantiaca]
MAACAGLATSTAAIATTAATTAVSTTGSGLRLELCLCIDISYGMGWSCHPVMPVGRVTLRRASTASGSAVRTSNARRGEAGEWGQEEDRGPPAPKLTLPWDGSVVSHSTLVRRAGMLTLTI